MKITSLSNGKIKRWAKLKEKKYRDQEGQFLVEGEHLIEEAYAAGCLCALIVLHKVAYPRELAVDVYEVSEEIMRKLTTLTSMEPWIGVCNMPVCDDRSATRFIVLDGVQDPGNLGTIIRTAIAFGYHAMVLSQDCVDVYNEKVVRSTQGAVFHIPVLRKDLQEYLPALRKRGVVIYATDLHHAMPLQEAPTASDFAIVFGNEGSGVRASTLALCEYRIKIEMEAFESLNVAVAAGICMYYFYHKESF